MPIASEHVADGPVFENVLMDNQVDVLRLSGAAMARGRRRLAISAPNAW